MTSREFDELLDRVFLNASDETPAEMLFESDKRKSELPATQDWDRQASELLLLHRILRKNGGPKPPADLVDKVIAEYCGKAAPLVNGQRTWPTGIAAIAGFAVAACLLAAIGLGIFGPRTERDTPGSGNATLAVAEPLPSAVSSVVRKARDVSFAIIEQQSSREPAPANRLMVASALPLGSDRLKEALKRPAEPIVAAGLEFGREMAPLKASAANAFAFVFNGAPAEPSNGGVTR